MQAILDGAQQIAVPAFVSTLCICIVFVPVWFITGAAKSLFTPLAMAVVFAMLTSYLLSRTLVPTMVHYLLESEVELYGGVEQEGIQHDHANADHHIAFGMSTVWALKLGRYRWPVVALLAVCVHRVHAARFNAVRTFRACAGVHHRLSGRVARTPRHAAILAIVRVDRRWCFWR